MTALIVAQDLILQYAAPAILEELLRNAACTRRARAYVETAIWVPLLLDAACLAVTIAGPRRLSCVPGLGPVVVRLILGNAGRPEADEDGGACPRPTRLYHYVPRSCSCHDTPDEELRLTGGDRQDETSVTVRLGTGRHGTP